MAHHSPIGNTNSGTSNFLTLFKMTTGGGGYYSGGGGGGVLSMSRYMHMLRGKDPPLSVPMVRQMTPPPPPFFQHGQTYDLILTWYDK